MSLPAACPATSRLWCKAAFRSASTKKLWRLLSTGRCAASAAAVAAAAIIVTSTSSFLQQLIGEMSFLTCTSSRQPASASVIAHIPSTILLLSRDQANLSLQANPVFFLLLIHFGHHLLAQHCNSPAAEGRPLLSCVGPHARAKGQQHVIARDGGKMSMQRQLSLYGIIYLLLVITRHFA